MCNNTPDKGSKRTMLSGSTKIKKALRKQKISV